MYRDDYGESYGQDDRSSEEVYSKPVKAGKRTYFFDVKATRSNNDYYLIITESKKKTDRDGHISRDKHKIFLYKEDFEKFSDGLHDALDFIKNNCLKDDSGNEGYGKEESPADGADSSEQF